MLMIHILISGPDGPLRLYKRYATDPAHAQSRMAETLKAFSNNPLTPQGRDYRVDLPQPHEVSRLLIRYPGLPYDAEDSPNFTQRANDRAALELRTSRKARLKFPKVIDRLKREGYSDEQKSAAARWIIVATRLGQEWDWIAEAQRLGIRDVPANIRKAAFQDAAWNEGRIM